MSILGQDPSCRDVRESAQATTACLLLAVLLVIVLWATQ